LQKQAEIAERYLGLFLQISRAFERGGVCRGALPLAENTYWLCQ
jgi:hypothetical protein